VTAVENFRIGYICFLSKAGTLLGGGKKGSPANLLAGFCKTEF
jgi:hypothetical protein